MEEHAWKRRSREIDSDNTFIVAHHVDDDEIADEGAQDIEMIARPRTSDVRLDISVAPDENGSFHPPTIREEISTSTRKSKMVPSTIPFQLTIFAE